MISSFGNVIISSLILPPFFAPFALGKRSCCHVVDEFPRGAVDTAFADALLWTVLASVRRATVLELGMVLNAQSVLVHGRLVCLSYWALADDGLHRVSERNDRKERGLLSCTMSSRGRSMSIALQWNKIVKRLKDDDRCSPAAKFRSQVSCHHLKRENDGRSRA